MEETCGFTRTVVFCTSVPELLIFYGSCVLGELQKDCWLCRVWLPGSPCPPASLCQPDVSYADFPRLSVCSQPRSQPMPQPRTHSPVLSSWVRLSVPVPGHHLLPFGAGLLFVLPGLLLNFPSGSWQGPTGGLSSSQQPQLRI